MICVRIVLALTSVQIRENQIKDQEPVVVRKNGLKGKIGITMQEDYSDRLM